MLVDAEVSIEGAKFGRTRTSAHGAESASNVSGLVNCAATKRPRKPFRTLHRRGWRFSASPRR
jgi:hypothetical protein